MTEIANVLWWLLQWIRDLTGSYGVAIIGLTVLVRVVLLPLGVAQFRAMEGQKRIQPKLAELQKKYKDNPQELQRRMMALYKEHRVNPMSGCLPALIQLPVLWGLFLALQRMPAGSVFLFWDLSVRDPYFVWPILAAVSQYLSMRPTMDPKQNTTMLAMSGVSGAFAAGFPAGLAMYWTVQSLLMFVQYWFLQRRLATAEGGVRAA